MTRRLFLCLWLLTGLPCVASSLHAQAERPLFDGVSLQGWERSDFVTPGPVEVREGAVMLGRGEPLTGITWAQAFPSIRYEVTLEAMRREGSDFFSAVTFPVGDRHCTLVIGGWGGRVVGLSSLEGADASENETSRWMTFEDGRWYRIRLRVGERRIEAWIDDEQVVDLEHVGRLLSTRLEVIPSQPFGIAAYQTAAALREIRLLEVPAGDDGYSSTPPNPR